MKLAYFDYSPYFELMKKMGISQNRLINEYGTSRGTISSMKKNKGLTLATCLRYMSFLGITDVDDFVICSYIQI